MVEENVNTEETQEEELETEPTANDAELTELKANNTTYKNALKSIFGIAAADELGDINKHMADFNNAVQAKIAVANEKIITAEIKALQGYDSKLLAKVIDRSNIKVDDNGTVTGLQEAVETAAKEYPAVVIKPSESTPPYAPYHPGSTTSTGKTMNDIIRSKRR